MEKTLILNPDYILRNDIHRVILTNKDGSGVTTFIHPLHAMILSFFDLPLEYSKNIQKISETLGVKVIEIEGFINKLAYNSEKIWIGEGVNACHFPENILIDIPKNYISREYNFRDFIMNGESIDLITKRFYIPIETTLMINSLCYTDCIYCYADRNYKFDSKIPFERLCEIIDEAQKLNFRKFDTSGGEFFLYKNWEKLLEKLVTSGFNPTIPTKIPLTNSQINKIKEKGTKQIQISLDSTNAEDLSNILKVTSDYWKKLHLTFKELERVGLKFRVNTIITSLNCNFLEINKLIEYLMTYENFDEVTIGTVSFSLYKSNSENKSMMPLKLETDKVIGKLKEKYANNNKVKISETPIQENNFHFLKDAFFKKAMCTGNLHLFYILADGKVTLCEELYWHPKFIIGDLKKQSIMEMWNSDKALDLYNLKQSEINEKSSCKRCAFFDDCNHSGSKCWREILKVYGKDNWDFPDPRCPMSPDPINNVYIG